MISCVVEGPVCVAAHFAIGAFALALLLTLIRLFRGPSTSDRVVAFEVVTVLLVATIGVYALITNEGTILSAAWVPGLIGFLGTVAFARYLEETG